MLKELNNKYKEVREEIIKKQMKDGFSIEEIRNILINGGSLVGLNDKIENLNNGALMTDFEKQILKDEIDVLIELLNKYCKPTKLITGKADDNGEVKNYSYVITSEYKMVTREEHFYNYKLIEKEINYTDFRVNNKNVKSFIVDLEHSLFLEIS